MINRVAVTTLFAVLLIVGVGINITSVHAQAAFVTVPLPNTSARNQIIDFYAGGTSEGYTIRASPQGATLSINGLGAITLMPWGYVTAQWSQGRIYIIFLANVTQTDFGIGFLYLRNSTDTPFILRWFDYKSGDINNWTFQGAQHVFNRTVTTVSVDMPKLQIPAAPEVTNALSALGPDLYLTERGGQLYNDTTLLTIYPLVNQLFGGSTDYNEVWSLLTDRVGNYYFAILYMQNNDAYHVIVEHQLRLNDYRKFDGRTVDARWVKGSFSNQVTVRTGQSNLSVLVDGFPFQTNDRGLVSLAVPSGQVNIQVPAEIQNSGSSRLRFSSWSNFGSANPLSLRLNSSLDISGNYTQEYSLTIATPYGTPVGAGWYARGANASFGVPSQVDSGNGTRMVFEKWQGDNNSTSNQTWAVMNSAKQVTALWTTQYEVTVTPVGLPDNASAQISVANSMVTVNGSTPYILWVNQNAPLSINVQSTQVQQSTTNYVYSGLRVDNQTVMGGLTITKPVDVAVIFTGVPKDSINVNLQVSPAVAAPGIPLSITGSVQRSPTESKSITLLYSLDNASWQRIADVPVSPDGTFSYAYPFTQPGSYHLKAYWPGDSEHSPASQVVNVRIIDSTVPILGTSDSLTRIMGSVEDAVRKIPYASTLLTLAGTIMTLGYSLTMFVVPGGSPIIGYIIGSFLVGFVYVFPISAAVTVLRAATSHRRPSFLWITPLLVLWLVSLGVLVASFQYAILQPFSMMAEFLLLLCNMFLMPIATSLSVARAMA